MADELIEQQRERMVREQLEARGISNPRVLQALRDVPREAFVPPEEIDRAYCDMPLNIGFGQTISQPYTVAFMAQALELRGPERILEIGTGSGYAAAVLSRLGAEVFTVERIPELAEQAAERLQRLGFANVHVRSGDGTLGWVDEEPFHAIVAAAGGKDPPLSLFAQLEDRGRLVIPLGPNPNSQRMYRFRRHGERILEETLGSFAFVPLIGMEGWSEAELR